MRVKDFLESELVDFASYSTLRTISNYIDGLKNAHRKVVFGAKKLNLNKEEKVSQVQGKIESVSNYLHGNISGSIVTLARNFTGTNNLPLLKREGNFGTRFIPEASATRYIFTQKEDYFDLIFREDDEPTLIQQNFEGDDIEPRYYTPVIPLLVINGSEGIATGFAQKILPRNLSEVIDYLDCKLQDKKCETKLLPFYNNFDGEIKEVGKNKFEIRGFFEKERMTIKIFEIPIGYNYRNYLKVLDDLEDKKIINSYKDLSDSKKDKFLFQVRVKSAFPSESEKILEKLKLKKTITENLTTIDENNKIRVFENVFEIFDSFIDIRLKHLKIKKDLQLKKLLKEIAFFKDRIKFINLVIENKIIINKKSKNDIILQATKFDIKFIEEHLKMQLWNLTSEKMKELEIVFKKKEEEYKTLLNKNEKEIWLDELNILKKYI